MNAWVAIDPCSGSSIGGATAVFMEQLTVTGPNALGALSKPPNLSFFMLSINGEVFQPVGLSPPFTVSGAGVVTWLSTVFGFDVGDVVIASYSY